jgi:hypothetical protein
MVTTKEDEPCCSMILNNKKRKEKHLPLKQVSSTRHFWYWAMQQTPELNLYKPNKH